MASGRRNTLPEVFFGGYPVDYSGEYMAIQILSQSTTEPVSLADMKQYITVDFTDDDTVIGNLITETREYLEGRTQKNLINTVLVLSYDGFPIIRPIVAYSIALPLEIPINSLSIFDLPMPLVSVDKVAYIKNGASGFAYGVSGYSGVSGWSGGTTLDESEYVVDTIGGRLQITTIPTDGTANIASVQITCTVGGCSNKILTALKAIVADAYRNREAHIPSTLQLDERIERIIWLERDITLA